MKDEFKPTPFVCHVKVTTLSDPTWELKLLPKELAYSHSRRTIRRGTVRRGVCSDTTLVFCRLGGPVPGTGKIPRISHLVIYCKL